MEQTRSALLRHKTSAMRERQKKKKGRTWAEAAKTVFYALRSVPCRGCFARTLPLAPPCLWVHDLLLETKCCRHCARPVLTVSCCCQQPHDVARLSAIRAAQTNVSRPDPRLYPINTPPPGDETVWHDESNREAVASVLSATEVSMLSPANATYFVNKSCHHKIKRSKTQDTPHLPPPLYYCISRTMNRLRANGWRDTNDLIAL